MAGNIWLISDCHFGHANILKFVDTNGNLIRGSRFSCLEDMDQHMVDCWNSVVKDSDKVYNLGDVYFGQGHQLLPRLKGHKRLILGNHDNAKDQHLQKHFEKITVWRQFREFNMVLTHVPLHTSNLEFQLQWNVHGHIHQNLLPDPRYFNVSCEQVAFTPVHIEEVAAQLKSRN